MALLFPIIFSSSDFLHIFFVSSLAFLCFRVIYFATLFCPKFYRVHCLPTPFPRHYFSVHVYFTVASPRGGEAGQLAPPPQPPIGHPVRSMQIRGDFRVRKKWGQVYRIYSEVLHALTLRRTFFGLTITKKKGVVEVVEGVTLVGPRGSCGALWDLSVLALAFPSIHFFFVFKCEFWALPKK